MLEQIQLHVAQMKLEIVISVVRYVASITE